MTASRLKLVIGVATGGVVGWFVNEGKNKYISRKCNKQLNGPQSDLQKQLASWSSAYTPTTWDSNWDRRDPKFIENPNPKKQSVLLKDENNNNEILKKELKKPGVPKAARNLILIRHGQYNLAGKEDTDRTLTLLGCEQAELTGHRLAELAFPYTVIIHSTMTRARETANIIHKFLPGVKMTETDLLREGAPFPPEPPLQNWKPDFKEFYEDGARIEAAFRNLFHRADAKQETDSYEVIVCHANVIRYFVCRALQLPPEAWLRMSLNHASMTWVTIRSNGRVHIKTLGDSGHITKEKLSVA